MAERGSAESDFSCPLVVSLSETQHPLAPPPDAVQSTSAEGACSLAIKSDRLPFTVWCQRAIHRPSGCRQRVGAWKRMPPQGRQGGSNSAGVSSFPYYLSSHSSEVAVHP